MSRDSLDAVLSPLAIAAAFLAVGAVVWVLRRAVIATESRAESEPLPDGWLHLLEKNVPASAGLTAAEQARLLRLSRDLIGRVRWEGRRGVIVDETMQLVIAAQACLMTIRIPGEHYENAREILLYPSMFVPRGARHPLVPMSTDGSEPQPELGETWTDGVVVLSWDSVKEGTTAA
ncbi:MAG TPA: zinc-dependent peptidase [Gemmatimonadaceae bacterium]|nr:zinc-dependent peptidase [Gemmatimonadaceae bacterium]